MLSKYFVVRAKMSEKITVVEPVTKPEKGVVIVKK